METTSPSNHPATAATSIPSGYRTLIACLRGAFNGVPPEVPLEPADWPSVFRQACEQGVDTFLYPWLATRIPERFSATANVSVDSAPAAWRARFLEALPHTSLRQRQIADILAALADAGVDVLVLKGAWLGATVYDDPVQRTMSDIDLLVRATDRDACHARLLALGYAIRTDTLHNRFAYDQSYVHPAYREHIELHWHFSSDMTGGAPVPDIAAIWQKTSPSVCCGQPVRTLAPEDQLAHVVQHMLHHVFAVPLRVYVDIALLVRKYGESLTPALLDAAGGRWRTGLGIPFALGMASELLACPLPPALRPYAPELAAPRRAQALLALFELPTAQARSGESTLLRFRTSSALARLRLVLGRIFMPRAFLAMRYPCARQAWGLPLAWFCRARDLHRQNRDRMKAMLTPGTEEEKFFRTAASRADLTDWLLRG